MNLLELSATFQSEENVLKLLQEAGIVRKGSAKSKIREKVSGNKISDNPKEEDIDEEKIQDLYNWLNDIQLSRPKKNLAREFSDGVLMAELLKQFFPKSVDMNNYRPANSLTNKLKNWNWMNEKVLKPLGISQDEKTLREILDFNVSKLEKLLILVKEKVEEQEALKIKREEEFQIISGRGIIAELDMETVSKEYSALKEELHDKNEEISTLEAKVEHLHAMLAIKDQRIDDLMAQLRTCTCQDQDYSPSKYLHDKHDTLLYP